MPVVDRQRSGISNDAGAKTMKTKSVFCLLTTALLLTASLAEAQQPAKKVSRIGILSGGSPTTDAAYHDAFLQGLRESGYIVGKNIFIEYRYAEGKRDRFAEFAAELVRLKVDVVVAAGATGILEAKKATRTIPIVMTNVSDPVALGFVTSLAKPGGNITGLSTQAPELSGKRLELLKEVLPKVSRVAVLWQPGGPGSALRAKETEAAASSLGMKVQFIEVKTANDFESAFSAIKKDRADALMPLRSPLIGNQVTHIIEFAAKSRLPAMYDEREFAEAGGLMFYGTDHVDLFHRAATFVAKILKGAKPEDLPVEQPTKFRFVINLKTAKEIGLTIPPNVLARADRVIR
jgi:putative ABC transport system substrate-binding protein